MFLPILLILFAYNLSADLASLEQTNEGLKVSTLYGSVLITEPVIIECIKSPPFDRLKKIRQYGIVCHARNNEPDYSRWEHSLAVFVITRLQGAPLDEQIDALLHDVSHTVFSHVGDIIFESDYRTGKYSYQDTIHEQYLKHSGLHAILEKYQLSNSCSQEAKNIHRCFDQPLPGLCADRIEYNLTGAFIDKLITHDQLTALLNNLHYADGIWFFDTIESAQEFGYISLTLSESRWGATWSNFIDYTASKALKRAATIGIISYDDIHYSVDDIVWQKLIESNDYLIAQCIEQIKQFKDHLKPSATGTIHIHGKFSGTDPFIKTESGFEQLSKRDQAYAQEFNRIKQAVATGCWID